MPVILLVGNKKDKSQEREVEKFDAERVRVIQPHKLKTLNNIVFQVKFLITRAQPKVFRRFLSFTFKQIAIICALFSNHV